MSQKAIEVLKKIVDSNTITSYFHFCLSKLGLEDIATCEYYDNCQEHWKKYVDDLEQDYYNLEEE